MATKLTKLKLEPVVSDESSDDDDARDSGNEDLSLPLDKLNIGPKKRLLVLCLVEGLLVHRVHKRDMSSPPRNRRPTDFVCGNFRIFKRPFCDEFLKFCFERFEVALWSSAMEHNVDPLLSYLMQGLRKKLLFVWDQEKCTNTGYECLDEEGKPIFLKELKKVWEKKFPSGNFSAANTLLIDNHPHKGLLNPLHTAIYPEPYKLDKKDDRFLAPKGELQLFLDGVADAEDVPTYVKEHAFGQKEITDSHSDWDYYSKIVACFSKTEAVNKKI